tara:strand:- start:6208 stop:7209 length:1002 start_codon:yes stop_codon:yes gene_type:complete
MIINRQASLKKFNTFNVSEVADVIYEVEDMGMLKNIVSDNKNQILILGGGSNILFTKSYNGVIINIRNKGIRVLKEDKDSVLIDVCSGENWNDFVLWAIDNNYGGIENLSLIPGNVGAAPIQNIGAYGVELKDVFYSASGIMLDSLEDFELYNSECKFSYRNSIFKNELKDKVIITSIKLKLTKGDHNYNIEYQDLKEKLSKSELSLKKISNEVIRIRQSKLPDHKLIGNCGSFFKNPIVSLSKLNNIKSEFPDLPSFKIDSNNYKIPAAWLIEKSGFKEIKNKNVGVYKNQPLVIINHGEATGKEILDFANEIKKTINNNFNIQLKEEVLII